MRAGLLAAVLAGGAVALSGIFAPAFAACTPTPAAATTTTCSGTTTVTAPLGRGSNGPDNSTIIVQNNAIVSAASISVISLRDQAVITIGSGAVVRNNATTGGGQWSAGQNTIEFRSDSILTVAAGASILAQGTATNAEAVQIIGAGNTIINYGLIDGGAAAAIWFEDKVIGAANMVDNFGTIQTGGGTSLNNVIGNQGNSQVIFINESNARVYGSLTFAGGNDQLTLYANSVITGGFNGGGGTNTLTLNGAQGSSDVLAGNITNFQNIVKTGEGTWTLSGIVGTNTGGSQLNLDVQQGTLALTGNNSNWRGSVVVGPAGTLRARAQSVPATASVTDNGLVWFTQDTNGSYANVISGIGAVTKSDAGTLTLSGANTYAGGTTLLAGILSVSADNNLGAASGPLTFAGGALQLTGSFTMSNRAISITAPTGRVITDAGVNTTIAQPITGAGTLIKDGPGQLTLTGTNTYGGDTTTIAAGTLQLGNGGTSGSIPSSSIVDNGTLALNRSDTVNMDALISGTGGVLQNGSGVTILSQNNSYKGPTTIQSGWLYINGNQSGATGDLTAQPGTRLGGIGTIGGNVIMGANTILAPGDAPTRIGTLTINGNLAMSATTNLFYNVQQAAAPGSQLADLTVVHGNLDLAGTINIADVAEPLGPGIYRIFNYDGTLTCSGNPTCTGSNGLAIGNYVTAPTSPQGSATIMGPLNDGTNVFSVQTAVANQVNLVNSGGITLQYWDVSPKNDSVINGDQGGGPGTSLWQAGGALAHWTGTDGATNGPWASGSFAVFMGTPGTVTVDNSADGGNVLAEGMQFAVGGYTVTGDAITLVNTLGTPYSVIRVGDGTEASAGMTARIDAALTGNSGVIKEDYGTLILGGINTYSGGTSILNGTLQISSDVNLGQAGTELRIANDGTLQTTASIATSRPIVLVGSAAGGDGGVFDVAASTSLALLGTVSEQSGSATLTKQGAGTLVLAGNDSYSGGTTIASGTLQLGNGGTSGAIKGNVVNNGVLAFNRSDPGVIFGGTISGTGALAQIGSGSTILTANNSYSGGTTIVDGMLQLGNGGTSGSIIGNVANSGTLVFSRSDIVTFAGLISDGSPGAGSVVQNGSGITILTANNSYSGTTTIQSGWLYVNGNQSAASGLLTAQAGTRLGGIGTIGGDVVMAANAILAPGGGPNQLGTLTINGNLTLNATTNVFYNLQEEGVAGGQLNDLTIVRGNLDLAGTVNVAYTGEALGAGIYRLFNYGGTLTCDGTSCDGSNGLQVGDYMMAPGSPQGSATIMGALNDGTNVFSVQTSVQNQVNLVNTGGMDLTYWDVVPNNNAINGGTGTWEVGGSLDNWTGTDGHLNSSWSNGGFAVFMGSPGTVTVDNSNDLVRTEGMQFAVDGYTVIGDAITLENAAGGSYAVIRVGDGTATGAAMTARIDAELTGTAGLAKEDYGTLILGGINTYSGGTAILNGTLQISSDANLGQAGTELRIANNATLQTTADITSARPVTLVGSVGNRDGGVFDVAAATTLTLAGVVREQTAPAVLTKAGDGTLVLSADNTYSGGSTVSAGILQLGAGGTTGSIRGNVTVIDNTASGAGVKGTLAFNRSDVVNFGGVVSGTGALSQVGSGTTILTGNSTYSGGTTIQNGTLQLGNGGTSGSITGDVVNNSVLAFRRSDTVTFGGTISGTGDLVQTGSGTTILTADNTYGGDTTISAGTLQLGNGGTTGSILSSSTSRVGDNGTLAINRSDTYTFASVVAGTGGLRQMGSGTTILTADSTYSGGTTIAAGELRIGDGGTTGSIQGDVVNQGLLSFNRSDDITFSGQVTGAGGLTQMGSGTTILTGNSTYSGGTTISAGTLQLGDGTTLGSVVGDIANNATLSFHHSDLLVMMGTISGSGAVVQDGSGNTVLYGDNSYSGATTVLGGGLYINGIQSGTGTTTVSAGATLGGGGTIGGNVTVADDATLSPGNVGAASGTLTINGNLVLNSTSILSYNFGEANVPGGAFNDLTVVKGNVSLNGSIEVTESEGGAFEPGIYRVINYGGTLGGTTLALGQNAAGLGLVVQTSVPNEINLVNTNGLAVNFWDLTPNDNQITGAGVARANGVWQLPAPDDPSPPKNWVDATGVYNSAYENGNFVIFMATPGSVTVDNTNGQVQTSGMQFASDGYVVTGDPLQLLPSDTSGGNASVIRVGDGSSDGAAMTATIDASLTGSAQLVKTDLGTLVLHGDNSYSGGTAINGGTLEVGKDASLGAAGTNVDLSDGTLHVTSSFDMARDSVLGAMGGTIETDSGVVLKDTGTISGEGGLTKTGEGILGLSGNNSYSGGTMLNEGGILVGNANALGTGPLTMADHTVLDFAGSTTIANDIGLTGTGVINVDDALSATLSGIVGDGNGTGVLQKTGGGTLVLDGNNTYSGGTEISGGTVQVGQDANLGAGGGGIAFDGGTLHVTAGFAMDRDLVLNEGGGTIATDAGVALLHDGAISGDGGLTKTGSGTLALFGPADYLGPTEISQGTLAAGAANVLSPNSAVNVAAQGVLDLSGHSQTVAELNNSGVVSLGTHSAPGAVLTVSGDYAGSGGTLIFNTHLGADDSPTDHLVVAGDATGRSHVQVVQAGGLGAMTVGNGIELITVNGVSAADAFALQGRVGAGAFEYMLFRGGTGADADNQNWYLRSDLACTAKSAACSGVNGAAVPIYRPEVVVDSAIAGLASRFGLGMLGTWHERTGGEFATNYARVEGDNKAAWARLFGESGSVGGGSGGDAFDRAAEFDRHGPSYSFGFAGIQAGMDLLQRNNRDGSRDIAGFLLGAGTATADVNAEIDFGRGSRAGSLTMDGYSFGGYYTHIGRSGWYVDAVAQGTRYDRIRATSNIDEAQTLATAGWGFIASVEAGYPILLAQGFRLEPQAQLVTQHLGFNNGSDAFGRIAFSDSDAFYGRIGARLAKDFRLDDGRRITAWVRASLWSSFSAQAKTTFSSLDGSNPTPIGSDLGGNWTQLDLGLQAQLRRNVAIFANASTSISLTQGQSYGGRGGVRVSW
ncbi:MAG: autotransporter-associated beta strand repeat-containing protein [Alphaproteobacteria bacterium]|nr:autotransporter-associated beta strand repeat-containing protein [Alphaproteobacteria bacterium]